MQRFFGLTSFCMLILVADCNHFFLKFVLWVPANHDILLFRVILIGVCSLAGAKELFEYISNEYCHRLGPFIWLSLYTVSVEILTIFKCSDGLFTEPFPWYVKVIWVCMGLGYLWLSFIAYCNSQREAESKKTTKEYNPYNPQMDIINHCQNMTS